MEEKTDLRKLLVLQGPALESGEIVSQLEGLFDVRWASELEEALRAMREGRFDAVLAETGDFLPLERGAATQHASVVLDRIGDGVCIVGPQGELAWANEPFRRFRPEVITELRKLCTRAYEHFATAGDHSERGRRFSLMPQGSDYYEVLCSPIRDRQGLLQQVVAVVVDATAQRRQQLKLNAIDRAGHELVRLEADTRERNAAERLKLLEERIIRYGHEVLNFENFAVLVVDEKTNRLEMLVSEGLEDEADQYELFVSATDNGISGYVAATGQSYICPDVSRDPRYLTGMHQARSSLTVPLHLHDKVIGVLNIESERPGMFQEEDRQFAEIFANHVALALSILNLLAFERHSTHTQVSGSIYAELAGPLTDIITDAEELKEDYIGLDDVRTRLDVLIDRATRARDAVHRVGRGPCAGVMGPTQQDSADPLFCGKRLLVADDEEVIRETVADVLNSLGCCVDVVCDGAQAISMVQQHDYDLVISDIKMPAATGYEVFSAVKDKNPDTPVILMTAFGYDPNHTIVRANREGLSAVLFKPFKVQQFVDSCREALCPAAS